MLRNVHSAIAVVTDFWMPLVGWLAAAGVVWLIWRAYRDGVNEQTPNRGPDHARAHAPHGLTWEGLQQQERVEREPVELLDGEEQVGGAAHCQDRPAAHCEAHLKGVEARPLSEDGNASEAARREAPRTLMRVGSGAQDEDDQVEVPLEEDAKAVLANLRPGEKVVGLGQERLACLGRLEPQGDVELIGEVG